MDSMEKVSALLEKRAKIALGGEGGNQQQGDKRADAVPAGAGPEHAAERPGDAGTQVVAEEIKR